MIVVLLLIVADIRGFYDEWLFRGLEIRDEGLSDRSAIVAFFSFCFAGVLASLLIRCLRDRGMEMVLGPRGVQSRGREI